jgi:hypothetical protein
MRCTACGFPVEALPLGLRYASLAHEEGDVRRPRFRAFLDDKIGPFALGHPGKYAAPDAGFRFARHGFDDLGLGRAVAYPDEAAVMVLPAAVAYDEALAQFHAKHLYMLGVAARYDDYTFRDIASGCKKSGHFKPLLAEI